MMPDANTALQPFTQSETACDCPTVESLCAWLQQYARERLNSKLADERRSIPPHILLDFGNQGLMGLIDPVEIGGCGLSVSGGMQIIRQLAAIDLSLAVMTALHNFLAGAPIRKYGSPSLRQELARDLASGRQLATFSLTEHSAGSDPRRMEAMAIRRTDGAWVLNGVKLWSGMAAWSGVMVTFAQTRDADGKDTGITAFAVRQRCPGVRQGPECLSTGLRAIVQNEIRFENVLLTEDDRLGPVGQGMKVAQEAMMLCRLVMGVLSLGAMGRSLQLLSRYVQRRVISSGRMIENPIVLERLAQETARTTAVEAYIAHIYSRLDRANSPSDVPPEYFLACKIVCPEMMWLTVDQTMQLLGGRGYMEPNVVSRIMRDGRILRVFEGPTETLTAYLGALVALRPEPIRAILCTDLNASDLWREIEAFRSERLDQPLRLSPDAQRRNQYLLGDLAAYALFSAAVWHRLGPKPGPIPDPAAEFSHHLFMERRMQAYATPCTPYADTASLLTDLNALNDRIGSIDERSSGEDHGFDPFLAPFHN